MISSARHQALLSEYKGNLFEFLVGVALSQKLKLEVQFLKNISSEFKSMLQTQESFIREYYPDLLIDLPKLANELALEIITKLSLVNVVDIVIVGKVALAAQNTSFAEADLIIKDQNKLYPISIKLSKAKAYVNTKSAGLRSFFTKYFSLIEESHINLIQEQFNSKVDVIINEFGNEIYAHHDLEYDGSFSQWIMLGKTSLSGELSEDERVIYKKMLYKLNALLHEQMLKLQTKYKEEVCTSLLPLVGFGDENIIQATSYYKNISNHYISTSVLVEDISSLSSRNFEIGHLKESAANFDFKSEDRILQLRIKAMNKFTSKSFKINCSVKVN